MSKNGSSKASYPGLAGPEIAQAVTLLSKLPPGFLPKDIFYEIVRLIPVPIIEVVPLRITAGGITEILLLRREADDPIWPGQLHVPGTMVRATDTPPSFNDPFHRLLSEELAGTTTSEPVFVKNVYHHSGRGMEVSQVFWVEVRDEPAEGVFYDTTALPEDLVQSQLDFIPDAIRHFQQTKNISSAA